MQWPHARRISCAFGVALAFVSVSPRAVAQPAPSADPLGVPVMPPRQREAAAAQYPEGATGDAVVVVIVTVGALGTVDDVKVATGDEPFATAAVTAAKT